MKLDKNMVKLKKEQLKFFNKFKTFSEESDENIMIFQNTKEYILQREINMKCLNCGKSLKKEILTKSIRIHLCKKCRMIYDLF